MSRLLKRATLSVFLLVLSAGLAAANPGLPTADPAALNVGTTATVKVTSLITDGNVIPTSVNVQQLDAAGRGIATLGTLRDDGTNGDLLAGDRIYSGNVSVAGTALGQIRIRVSAAARGVVLRLNSPAIAIDVLPAGIPTQPNAPDLTKLVTDAQGNTIVANEVLACFADFVGVAAIQTIVASINATLAGRFSGLGNCYQLRLPDDSTAGTVSAAIQLLSTHNEVTAAEPHFTREMAQSSSPVLRNTAFSFLRLPQAQALEQGQGVLVAVLDTGVADDSRLYPLQFGRNFTTDDPIRSNDPSDNHGHGTHIAGIVRGTAPGSTILAIKVWDAAFGGGISASSASAWGIKAAVDAGARVINMSYDGDGYSVLEDLAVTYASIHNVVLVAAAGNDDSAAPHYPAALNGVIAVANISEDGSRWHTSNFGSWVDLSAPGVNILSTALEGRDAFMTGTSQATPFVSGTAALILGRNPSLSPASVEAQIKNNVIVPDVSTTVLGVGRLDAFSALTGVDTIDVEPVDPVMTVGSHVRLLASAKGTHKQPALFFAEARLRWESDHPDVVTIDEDSGELTAVAVGEAEITVTEMTTAAAIHSYCGGGFPGCPVDELEGKFTDRSTSPPTRRRIRVTVTEDPVSGVYDLVAVGGHPLPVTMPPLNAFTRVDSGQARFNDFNAEAPTGTMIAGFRGVRFPPPQEEPFGTSDQINYRVGDVSDVPVRVLPDNPFITAMLPPGRLVYGAFPGQSEFAFASLAADGRTMTMYAFSISALVTFVKQPPLRALRVTPDSRELTFTDTLQDVRSSVQTFTLENTGPEAVSIDYSFLLFSDQQTDPGPSNFVLVRTNGGCQSLIAQHRDVIAPGQSCSFEIAFQPMLTYTTGVRTAQMRFRTNSGSTSGAVFRDLTIDLEGTATGVPIVNVSPGSLSFPATASTATSPPQFVVVQNTGTLPLVLGLPTDSTISFNQDSTGCRTPLRLAPGASCSIAVTYIPFGDFSDVLNIPTNTGSITGSQFSNAAVLLSAVNQRPTANAGPDRIGVLTGISHSLDGTQSRDLEGQFLRYRWRIVTRPAGSVAELETPDSAFARLTPDVPGTYLMELIVNDGRLDSDPDTVVLTAVLPPGVLELSTVNLVFPETEVGERSATQRVSVTNTGPSPVTVASINNTGDFVISANSCATLAVQETCAIDVFFAPSIAGPRRGQLSIVSDAAESPRFVLLGGNVDDSSFSPPVVTGVGHISLSGAWQLRFFGGDDDEETWVKIGNDPEFVWEEDETPGRIVVIDFRAGAGTVRFAEDDNGGGLRSITIEPLADGRFLLHLADDDDPLDIELTLVLERIP